MHYDEFIPEFEKQYPEFPWKSVQVSPEQSRRGWGLPSPAGIGRVGVFAPPTETREGDGVSCNPPPTLDLVGCSGGDSGHYGNSLMAIGPTCPRSCKPEGTAGTRLETQAGLRLLEQLLLVLLCLLRCRGQQGALRQETGCFAVVGPTSEGPVS